MMNKRYFPCVCWIACLLLIPTSHAAQQAGGEQKKEQQQGPQEVVQTTSDQLLAILRNEKIEPETAQQQLSKIIDDILSPVIDFRRLAYRTMAKYYKRASTEQFLAFTEAIKQSLINTYANPLVEGDSRSLANKISIEIRSVQEVEGKTGTIDRAVVSTWLKVGNNQQYDVIYYLYFNKSKQLWLVENMVIEGINLLITYRNQYQRLISENNGNIDQVTLLWVQSKS